MNKTKKLAYELAVGLQPAFDGQIPGRVFPGSVLEWAIINMPHWFLIYIKITHYHTENALNHMGDGYYVHEFDHRKPVIEKNMVIYCIGGINHGREMGRR